MALKQKPKKKTGKTGSGRKHPLLRPTADAGGAQSSAPAAAAEPDASSVSTLELDNTTLLKSPLKTSLLFAQICARSATDAARNHAYIAISLIAIAIAGYFDVQLRTKDLSGGHFDFREDFSIAGIMYWIGLGFLSSFGMGFGLHTFVLFLAPAIIAHVSRYPHHSILENYSEVWWWSLSWGIGTAIGELPPYWAARAARLQNKRSAELDEEFAATADSGMVGRIKQRIQGMNMGFFSICLFASVPNPLFDLAGLMCGHNLVPFGTFFGATAVGKGLIKANLQTFFVLSVFNAGTKAWVTEFLRSRLPAAAFLKLESYLNQLANSGSNSASHGDSAAAEALTTSDRVSKFFVANAWDLIVGTVLALFLASVINSTVHNHLLERSSETKSKPATKQTDKSKKSRSAHM